MRWQLRRGLLNPADSPKPGSPWWRAINERLLYDGSEARASAFGYPGPESSPTVAAWLEFIRRPNAANWYRAHNMSVVSAYLEHGLGNLLDVGVITPRVAHLYAWSAGEPDTPGLRELLCGQIPC